MVTMPGDRELEVAKMELQFMNGEKTGCDLFDSMKKMPASAACGEIKQFMGVSSEAEPFALDYTYANPWTTKKENKGKFGFGWHMGR